jgi:Calcium binding
MASGKSDDEREKRIMMDIVVDAYGEEERALSWYYYLEENLSFPFRARCMTVRSISPLQVGEEVEVVGMPVEYGNYIWSLSQVFSSADLQNS